LANETSTREVLKDANNSAHYTEHYFDDKFMQINVPKRTNLTMQLPWYEDFDMFFNLHFMFISVILLYLFHLFEMAMDIEWDDGSWVDSSDVEGYASLDFLAHYMAADLTTPWPEDWIVNEEGETYSVGFAEMEDSDDYSEEHEYCVFDEELAHTVDEWPFVPDVKSRKKPWFYSRNFYDGFDAEDLYAPIADSYEYSDLAKVYSAVWWYPHYAVYFYDLEYYDRPDATSYRYTEIYEPFLMFDVEDMVPFTPLEYEEWVDYVLEEYVFGEEFNYDNREYEAEPTSELMWEEVSFGANSDGSLLFQVAVDPHDINDEDDQPIDDDFWEADPPPAAYPDSFVRTEFGIVGNTQDFGYGSWPTESFLGYDFEHPDFEYDVEDPAFYELWILCLVLRGLKIIHILSLLSCHHWISLFGSRKNWSKLRGILIPMTGMRVMRRVNVCMLRQHMMLGM